jgi:hypothetical protein
MSREICVKDYKQSFTRGLLHGLVRQPFFTPHLSALILLSGDGHLELMWCSVTARVLSGQSRSLKSTFFY